MSSVGSFGYFNIGETAWGAFRFGSNKFVAPSNGSMQNITVYIQNAGAMDGSVNFGYYNVSGNGFPSTHISHGNPIVITIGTSGWYTIPVSGNLIANTSYFIVYQQQGANINRFRYNSTGSILYYDGYIGSSWTFDNWSNNPQGLTTADVLNSVYATFSSWDIPPQAFSQTLSESFTMGDGTQKSDSIYKADTAQILDYIWKNPSLFKAETVTLTDYFNRIYLGSRTFPGDFSIVDSLIKAGSIFKGDTLTIADALRKADTANKTEAIAIADSFDRIWEAYKTHSEILTIADTAPKTVHKTLIDVS